MCLVSSWPLPMLRHSYALHPDCARTASSSADGLLWQSSTATIAVAWLVMLLPPALRCCVCPGGTGSGRSCTRRGSCDCSRPATPSARSAAPRSGSHPFCSDALPVVDRMRPELKGGSSECHHIAAQLAVELPLGLGGGWGGWRRRLAIGFSRTDASQQSVCGVRSALWVTLRFTQCTALLLHQAAPCTRLRMHPVA